MKEEDIDSRIERAVNELASKKALMAEWERERAAEAARKALRIRKMRTYGVSAAASLIVVAAVGTGLYLSHSGSDGPGVAMTSHDSAPVFRGGNVGQTEIMALMDADRYEDALKAIDEALADSIIDPALPDEQQEYMRNLYGILRYDMTWLKIRSLIRLDRKEEAIGLLRDYVREDGENQTAAKHLLNELTK